MRIKQIIAAAAVIGAAVAAPLAITASAAVPQAGGVEQLHQNGGTVAGGVEQLGVRAVRDGGVEQL